MGRGFMLGAILGGVVVWLCRDAALEYAEQRLRPARLRAADKLKVLQEKAENLADSAKEQISATLENTRGAVLPRGEGEAARHSRLRGAS